MSNTEFENQDRNASSDFNAEKQPDWNTNSLFESAGITSKSFSAGASQIAQSLGLPDLLICQSSSNKDNNQSEKSLNANDQYKSDVSQSLGDTSSIPWADALRGKEPDDGISAIKAAPANPFDKVAEEIARDGKLPADLTTMRKKDGTRAEYEMAPWYHISPTSVKMDINGKTVDVGLSLPGHDAKKVLLLTNERNLVIAHDQKNNVAWMLQGDLSWKKLPPLK